MVTKIVGTVGSMSYLSLFNSFMRGSKITLELEGGSKLVGVVCAIRKGGRGKKFKNVVEVEIRGERKFKPGTHRLEFDLDTRTGTWDH
ncbi:MAG: hypothetical protein Greene041619_1062 [Candidatus Peregrinibacteria bacterium Greene0416_19]|nr:MAG: hypothetical protein Greene041619_1062 [Candidatus Peregrinibacteria bacterium Greene0416_19]